MDKNEIFKNQEEIIYFVKKYLEKCKKANINIFNSSVCFFTNYRGTLGNATLKLKFRGYKYFFYYIKIFILHMLSIATLSNYYSTKKKFNNKNFKHLIVSNATRKDFKNNGSYFDSYFQTNTRSMPKVLWFLNCVDNYMPSKFDKNIILFGRKKNVRKFNIIFFIKTLFNTIFNCNFSIRKIYTNFLFFSQFSKIINKKILKEVSDGKFNSVVHLYEAQPFQNDILTKIKKINKKIKTVGFYHTALHAVPIGLIHKPTSLDKLLITGAYNKKYLIKYFNWPSKKIKVIPSPRYKKTNIPNMSGLIFLPYDFLSIEKIVEEFKNYLENSETNSINFLKIKNHPHKLNSRKHNKLIMELNKVMVVYKNRFSKRKNIEKKSIFVGPTTSLILALEMNINVVHICEDPIFDCYNEGFWKILRVFQISKNTFVYKLRKKQNLINLSTRNGFLKKYCA